MSEHSKALQKIAKGTTIVFVGTIISMFFGFLTLTIIARTFSKAEYGVFSLTLTVINIVLIIVTLGFPNSLPREVAFYKEKDPSKINRLISTVLIIVILSSILLMILLILEAENIARVFKDEKLTQALNIVAFSIPFSALTSVVISIFQGFGRVREKIYFQNIVYPTVFLLLIIFGVFLNLNFNFIFLAYVIAQAFTFMALIVEVSKIRLLRFELSLDLTLGRKLITFSIPLLFTSILAFVITWTDILMLGYYKGSEIVGLYGSASPLARLIPIFLNSAAFLYFPVVSQLYVQGKIGEMKRVYQVLTKWIFLLTLPIFIVMYLFPEFTIRFFFGDKYTPAALALQILALGFMFHTSLGLNGLSLIVIRESNFILIANLVATVLNVLLNVLLIPIYGIEGAAISTAVSYGVGNSIVSLRLYQKTRIHPFSWNYVKLLVISFVLLALIQNLNLKVQGMGCVILVLVAFLLIYFLLILVSKSVDREDVELLLAIEKKLGADLEVIRKFLSRFV